MKIPIYVERLIKRRCRLAMELNACDSELSDWLERNNIPVEECDYRTGCEMYCNPADSAERIRSAIENKI